MLLPDCASASELHVGLPPRHGIEAFFYLTRFTLESMDRDAEGRPVDPEAVKKAGPQRLGAAGGWVSKRRTTSTAHRSPGVENSVSVYAIHCYTIMLTYFCAYLYYNMHMGIHARFIFTHVHGD